MKSDINELAVFGNLPAFYNRLHVGRPYIGDREKLFARMNDMLDAKWLSNNGPYVQEFEREVCKVVGVKHCVALCNATVGLELAIRAANLSGEVIVPSFTFVATAHALKWLGITPVFCDIDPDTHNIDPAQIEALITPRTTGILGVHVWGRSCDIESLAYISEKYNLPVLYDAAHAFGCSHKGEMIGNFGLAEVFSFHATKFINTFEGGAVVTNDDTFALKLHIMRNFGFAGYDNVVSLGINGKMNEVSAAMGLTNLEHIGDFIDLNYSNYLRYQEQVADIPGVKLALYSEAERSSYQYIILEVDEAVAGISRDLLVEILHAENVLARRYFYPGCHQVEPYLSTDPDADLRLPETVKLSNRVMSLPTGTDVSLEDIDHICQIIRLVIENSSDVSLRLSQGQSIWNGKNSVFTPATSDQNLPYLPPNSNI